MKAGDKVYDECSGKTGVLVGKPYYHSSDRYGDRYNGVLELSYRVQFEDDTFRCLVEDLCLEENPQVSEFMHVQISMKADTYWGMTGVIVECNYSSALVRLHGYRKPFWFRLADIEPLKEGSDLECWLDSLVLNK